MKLSDLVRSNDASPLHQPLNSVCQARPRLCTRPSRFKSRWSYSSVPVDGILSVVLRDVLDLLWPAIAEGIARWQGLRQRAVAHLSPDGKTMTVALSRNLGIGVPFTSVSVYEKEHE